MDNNEPALVPEWLRGPSAGTNGCGNSLRHIASLLQCDDYSGSNSTRSKSRLQNGNTSRSSNRKSSQIRRTASSNGSILGDKPSSLGSRSYSSFSKSHREKDWDKTFDKLGKDRLTFRGHCNLSDPMMLSTNVLVSRNERDAHRRSFSILSAQRGELLSKNSANNLNSAPYTPGSILSPQTTKTSLERNFPSMGTEERSAAPDVRVKSPGLTSASPILSLNNSSVIGGDGRTSVLADVPVIIGSNSSVVLPAAESAPVGSASVSMSSDTTIINMAEALVQATGRTRTAPLLSIETQRLEELAIKQSRQLIPVTPSMHKTGTLSSDKSKPRGLRSNESSNASKAGQQLSMSQLSNHIFRGSSKSDSVKGLQPNGNFVILSRERSGFSNFVGDEAVSPTHCNSHVAMVASSKSPTAVKLESAGAKVSQISAADKKLAFQSKKRHEFFNSLRKKTAANNGLLPTTPDSSVSVTAEKHGEHLMENSNDVVDDGKEMNPASGPVLGHSLSDNGNAEICVSGCEFSCLSEPNAFDDSIALLDEEEEAFLKSLGWDAAAEEEALTDEEINAFYAKLYNL